MNNQNKRKIEENTEDSKQFGKLIFFIVLSVFVLIIFRFFYVGIFPYYVYRLCQKGLKQQANTVALFIAGISGGLVSTILVMNFIYFLFQKEYAQLIGKGGKAVYAAINAESDEQKRAHFSQQLMNLPTSHISTLHSFCLSDSALMASCSAT